MTESVAEVEVTQEPEFETFIYTEFDRWEQGELNDEELLAFLDTQKSQAQAEQRVRDLAYLESRTGIYYGKRGQAVESIEAFERSKVLYQQLDDHVHVTACNLNVGVTARLKGDFGRAIRAFEFAYESALRLNHEPLQTVALLNQAQALSELFDWQTAKACLQQCLALSEVDWTAYDRTKKQRDSHLLEVYETLAMVALRETNYDSAWEYAKPAFELAHQTQLPEDLGKSYRLIANIISQLGESPDDIYSNDPNTYFQQALESYEQVNAIADLAKTHFEWGKSLAQREQTDQAEEHFDKALGLFSQLERSNDVARVATAKLSML